MNFLSSFFSLYNSLSEDDVFFSALDGLLKNKDSLKNATIYDMAEMCAVSKTTLNRLAKRLGYDSFKAFKYDMVRSFSKYGIHNHLISIKDYGQDQDMASLALTTVEKTAQRLRESLDLDLIRSISKALHRAERIRFYMEEMPAVRTLQTNLSMDGKNARIVAQQSPRLEDARRLGPDSLVVALDIDHADSLDDSQILDTLQEQGAAIVLLGASAGNPAAKTADYYLECMFCSGSISLYGVSMCLDILGLVYRKHYMMD